MLSPGAHRHDDGEHNDHGRRSGPGAMRNMVPCVSPQRSHVVFAANVSLYKQATGELGDAVQELSKRPPSVAPAPADEGTPKRGGGA